MKNILSLFLLSLVLMSCSQNENEEPEEPSDYKIVYNVLEDAEKDNYEIYVMNTDGSGKKNISNREGVDWVYYAYEDKIYFLSDRDTCHRCAYFLYESDAEGKNIKKITSFPLKDSWFSSRKNGTEFVVTPKTKADSAFYIIDLQGNILQKVHTGLPYFSDPSFSPNGEQIVFRGGKEKTENGLKYIDELYIINVNARKAEQLTFYPKDDTTAMWYAYHAGPPFWESNKNFISFTSFRKGSYSIFMIDPDGKNLKQITDDNANHTYHSWSKGGNFLALEISDTTSNPNYDIYIMHKDGSNLKRLTSDKKYEQAPVFVMHK
jgi:TolB protein